MEDKQIIQLFQERDERAVEEVGQVYGDRLRRLAQTILESREDAEECVNDTLWKAWRAIPPTVPEYLYAFLAKVCRNTALDRLECRNAQMRKGILLELTAEMEQCVPNQMEEDRAEGRELRIALNQFLEKLSQEKRLIFMRRYWYGDSVAEIAKRYQVSESKVKTTLFRTRKELQKYLEKENIAL